MCSLHPVRGLWRLSSPLCTELPFPTDGLSITLDKRPIKTPSGKKLLLPHSKILAATMIAAEWENQEKVLKSHALPMVSSCTVSSGPHRSCAVPSSLPAPDQLSNSCSRWFRGPYNTRTSTSGDAQVSRHRHDMVRSPSAPYPLPF